MHKNIDVVIGSNFGDEGKGKIVDYYASKYNKSLTIRFNGGAQAGHTVITPSGKRHVFSHFGSGSFHNSHTYLSQFFVSNPLLFFKELSTLSVTPVVYTNKNGYITTPYDMMINQITEKKRGLNRHGSCGVGFNETIERNIKDINSSLKIDDLLNDIKLKDILHNIRDNYSKNRLSVLGYEEEFEKNKDVFLSDSILNNFIEDLKQFKNNIIIVDDNVLDNYENLIFEGAQGLLLDQYHKWFPHVTRSSTGLENVVEIVNHLDFQELNVNYLTRSYLTRHGAGPLPYELDYKPYDRIIDETNIPNDYQGSLRFAPFNIDLLYETIYNDLRFEKNINGQLKTKLIINCVDQIDHDHFSFVVNDKLREKSFLMFEHDLMDKFNCPIFFGFNEKSNFIKELK